MANIVIIVILVIICVFAVLSIVKRARHGSACCGERDAPEKKIKVKDKDKSHYPFLYSLTIEDMHCSNCVRAVENALNENDGVWATVSLEKKTATVRTKKEWTEDELSEIVSSKGYPVVKFEKL